MLMGDNVLVDAAKKKNAPNPALTLPRLPLRFRLRGDAAKNPCRRVVGRNRRAGYAPVGQSVSIY
jgi:hypothetical protein